MKKFLTLMALAGMIVVVSCGPSKEEQEKAAKAKADSIAKAEKAKADSIAAAEAEAEALEKAKQDSIAAADSIAKANAAPKNTAKPKPKPTKKGGNAGGRG